MLLNELAIDSIEENPLGEHLNNLATQPSKLEQLSQIISLLAELKKSLEDNFPLNNSPLADELLTVMTQVVQVLNNINWQEVENPKNSLGSDLTEVLPNLIKHQRDSWQNLQF